MKVEGQQHLLALLKQAGDPEADKLQQAIMQENRRKRFDLGVNAGAGILLEKLEAKDWKEAEAKYKELVRKFDEQGGGNLFYQIVRPYVTFCIEDQQFDQAREGLRYAEKRMPMDKKSILSGEFQTLSDKIKEKQSK